MSFPTRRRTLPAALSLVAVAALVSGLLTLVVSSSSQAAGSSLCTGYAGCKRAGYGDDGYGAASGRMYWQMYSGHNCTNYVAYRMIRAGMSATKPWSGTGMAYNWGRANASITDQVPRVGAVAWWDRYDGVGSSGHVAYVERVVSPNEVIVSQDSWGGDFSWARLVKGTSSWPSGFVHFKDKPVRTLRNTVRPVITGTPAVGSRLQSSTGTWSPPAGYRFQWYAGPTAIPRQNAYFYTPTSDTVGKVISVRVTAVKAGYTSATVPATTTSPVAAGAMRTTAAPVITGQPFVGQTLTTTPGTYAPAATSTVIKWTADNRLIAGAQGPRLVLTDALLGKTIGVQVVARRAGFAKTVAKASGTVGPIVAGVVRVTRPATVVGGTAIGARLSVAPGAYTPADARPTYQWLRDGEAIPGATGASYTVTGSDLGRDLAAQVVVAKPRFRAAVARVPVAQPVWTRSTVTGSATGKKKAAIVVVRLQAVGASAPSGTVKVRLGKRYEKAQVQNGRARVVFRNLKAGRYSVATVYPGSDSIRGSRHETAVQVGRR